MLDLVLAGVFSAIGFYLILLQMDIKKVCGYHTFFDIMFSLLLIVAYQGTFSGMVVAFIGGISITFLLWFTKGLIGYKYYSKGEWHYSIGW